MSGFGELLNPYEYHIPGNASEFIRDTPMVHAPVCFFWVLDVAAERYALNSYRATATCRRGFTDYTHIINIGNNDIKELLWAFSRYTIGGDGYVDLVAFEDVFEVIDGVLSLTFAPMMRVGGASVNGATLREMIAILRSLRRYG